MGYLTRIDDSAAQQPAPAAGSYLTRIEPDDTIPAGPEASMAAITQANNGQFLREGVPRVAKEMLKGATFGVVETEHGTATENAKRNGTTYEEELKKAKAAQDAYFSGAPGSQTAAGIAGAVAGLPMAVGNRLFSGVTAGIHALGRRAASAPVGATVAGPSIGTRAIALPTAGAATGAVDAAIHGAVDNDGGMQERLQGAWDRVSDPSWTNPALIGAALPVGIAGAQVAGTALKAGGNLVRDAVGRTTDEGSRRWALAQAVRAGQEGGLPNSGALNARAADIEGRVPGVPVAPFDLGDRFETIANKAAFKSNSPNAPLVARQLHVERGGEVPAATDAEVILRERARQRVLDNQDDILGIPPAYRDVRQMGLDATEANSQIADRVRGGWRDNRAEVENADLVAMLRGGRMRPHYDAGLLDKTDFAGGNPRHLPRPEEITLADRPVVVPGTTVDAARATPRSELIAALRGSRFNPFEARQSGPGNAITIEDRPARIGLDTLDSTLSNVRYAADAKPTERQVAAMRARKRELQDAMDAAGAGDVMTLRRAEAARLMPRDYALGNEHAEPAIKGGLNYFPKAGPDAAGEVFAARQEMAGIPANRPELVRAAEHGAGQAARDATRQAASQDFAGYSNPGTKSPFGGVEGRELARDMFNTPGQRPAVADVENMLGAMDTRLGKSRELMNIAEARQPLTLWDRLSSVAPRAAVGIKGAQATGIFATIRDLYEGSTGPRQQALLELLSSTRPETLQTLGAALDRGIPNHVLADYLKSNVPGIVVDDMQRRKQQSYRQERR